MRNIVWVRKLFLCAIDTMWVPEDETREWKWVKRAFFFISHSFFKCILYSISHFFFNTSLPNLLLFPGRYVICIFLSFQTRGGVMKKIPTHHIHFTLFFPKRFSSPTPIIICHLNFHINIHVYMFQLPEGGITLWYSQGWVESWNEGGWRNGWHLKVNGLG